MEAIQQEFFFDLDDDTPLSLFQQYMRYRQELIRTGELVLIKVKQRNQNENI